MECNSCQKFKLFNIHCIVIHTLDGFRHVTLYVRVRMYGTLICQSNKALTILIIIPPCTGA